MTEDERLRILLRRALPPVDPQAPAPDLWPRMRRRIERPRPASWPWFDLALGAAAAGMLLAFPQLIPWILMQT